MSNIIRTGKASTETTNSLEALTRKLETSLEVTSLADLAKGQTGRNVALLLDVSGSMDGMMRNGKRKIDGLREAVKDVTDQHNIPLIGFGMRVPNNPFGDGVDNIVGPIPDPFGGTPLAEAINFARMNEHRHIVVVSDGMPNSKTEAFAAATAFGGRIDVIYVGNPGDAGEMFLKELANSTGGTEFTGDLSQPKEITSGIIGFLTAGD